MDCNPPGSSVHGIFQAGILEWVAISFSIRIGKIESSSCTYKINKTMEIRKYFELTDNENIISEILWDAAKAMLREKFIALNIYIF